VTLERAGTPVAVVASTAFERLARHEAHTLGKEALPILVVDHPLGGEPPERVAEKAARAVAQLVAPVTG